MQHDFQQLDTLFQQAFQVAPSHHFAAPGRVNLIGEHTDYNDGFVLPCAIDRHTLAAVTPRDDQVVRVMAADYEQRDEFSIAEPVSHHAEQPWANYIRGVIAVLQQRGYALHGMDIAISGNIPQGAGLSSSASLEVLIAQCFSTLSNLNLSPTDMALIGQQAENEFVGCMCGVMDQLISASGVAGHALIIDCRSLETQQVIMPDSLNLLIIDSNKPHAHVDGEYNTRRRQCEAAAAYFGVKALRDVNLAELKAATDLDPMTAKRAFHVVSENERVLAAAEALEQGDIAQLSKLMAQSHVSMRDDFEISVPEIDWLVATVKSCVGKRGGVRMTGGGFGGCVVALVPDDAIEPVKQAINAGYEAEFGLQATFYLCRASGGVAVV
ncbi:MAG: galactokinase [Thiolinea sp.]